MKLNDIKIEKKKIYDELSLEDINERKIFGGTLIHVVLELHHTRALDLDSNVCCFS